MSKKIISVAAAAPKIKVADCSYNSKQIINMVRDAAAKKAELVVFPELCITGSTCGDLFFQKVLIDSARDSLDKIAEETADLNTTIIVGLPIAFDNELYNCAAVVHSGKIIGFVPKKNLSPMEKRYFTSGNKLNINAFQKFVTNYDLDFTICIAVGSDSFEIVNADVNCRVCATPELVGSSEKRLYFVENQSKNLGQRLVFANAGLGESTTANVFSGHCIIASCGDILAESKLFSDDIIFATIDLRMTGKSVFDDFTEDKAASSCEFLKMPFVPEDAEKLRCVCRETLDIQAVGLSTRLEKIGCKTVLLGVSGGLDSTLALIATARAFDILGYDRAGIFAVTMPCFGTTARTKNNAVKLAKAFGATLKEIDITESVMLHFKDIGHDPNVHDVTYENAQARERTQILMDMANMHGGIVVGTGDLSEAALGFATFNGDHMSMYAINCSVPKTLIRHIVAYAAEQYGGELSETLLDVINTPVSPELLPPTKGGKTLQRTEDIVGPYELHDFFLYYFIKFGFAPQKLLDIAFVAFENKYTKNEIRNWLSVFIDRFFKNQFKRNAMPDGPKTGHISLSQLDWQMPSDASAKIWLKQLNDN